MSDVVDDDQLLEELTVIADQREQRDLAEARERIEQRRAQEAAEAEHRAEVRRRQAKHAAAVIRAHEAASELLRVAGRIDMDMSPDSLVTYNAAVMVTVPLLSEAGRDGPALEQALSVQLVVNFRDAYSRHGMPPVLRALVPGRVEGAVVKPLSSIVDVVLRDLSAELVLAGPLEVSPS